MALSHFLQGQVEIQVQAPFPQRLLNLCAQETIPFWGLQWHSPQELYLNIHQRDYPRVKRIAQNIQAQVTLCHRKGLPTLLARWKHRVGFLLGFFSSLLAVSLLSHFLLVVEIQGNDTIETALIRSALDEAGLHVGAFGPQLKLSHLSQVVLSQVEGLSWVSINVYGTRAEVLVREATPAPHIPDTQGLSHLVASTGGLIEEIHVYKGEALVAQGDTVAQGQVLIRGNVELASPLYSDLPSQWLEVQSGGTVVARTWHQLTAVIPLSAWVKEPHETTDYRLAFTFFGQYYSFFPGEQGYLSGYEGERQRHALPGLEAFPLSWTLLTHRPYTLVEQSLNRKECRNLLEATLEEELEQRIAPGEILSSSFSAQEQDGLLYVTLWAECRENIALTQEGQEYVYLDAPSS